MNFFDLIRDDQVKMLEKLEDSLRAREADNRALEQHIRKLDAEIERVTDINADLAKENDRLLRRVDALFGPGVGRMDDLAFEQETARANEWAKTVTWNAPAEEAKATASRAMDGWVASSPLGPVRVGVPPGAGSTATFCWIDGNDALIVEDDTEQEEVVDKLFLVVVVNRKTDEAQLVPVVASTESDASLGAALKVGISLQDFKDTYEVLLIGAAIALRKPKVGGDGPEPSGS